jgi:hypothetical protein
VKKHVINVALGNEALWGTVVLRKEVESEAMAHPAEFGKVLVEAVKESMKHAHSEKLGVRYPYTMSQHAMLAFAAQGFAPYVDLDVGYCYGVMWDGEHPTFMFSYAETHKELDAKAQYQTKNAIHFIDHCTRWQKKAPEAKKVPEAKKAAEAKKAPEVVKKQTVAQKDAKSKREAEKERMLVKAHKGAAPAAAKFLSVSDKPK